MSDIFDIFLLEAVLNGLLLGGLLALLSLGLNLIFGVIDVVWICYAELIMIGMYTIWWLHSEQGWPLLLAFPAAVAFIALLGFLLHQYVVRPVLAAEPINQLLVTGGVLFLLQAVATMVFGVEFRNIGVRLPGVNVGEMNFSLARIVAFRLANASRSRVRVTLRDWSFCNDFNCPARSLILSTVPALRASTSCWKCPRVSLQDGFRSH
nr:hypothetical protein [Burkholderiaceae bacterium]